MRWKRSLVLLFWLGGILFPLAWLGNFSPRYLRIFNSLFSPEWMHWLMHIVLYAGLAIFLVWVFELAISRKSLTMIVLAGLTISVFQEGLQVFSGVQILRMNTVFDLGVDTLGVLIGFGLAALVKGKRRT